MRKTIPGYENYEIDAGGVVSNAATGKILKPYLNTYGYPSVSLYSSDNGKRKTFAVHILVGRLFVENKFNKQQLNHKNGDKTDPRAENLEWATPSENVKHSYDNLSRRYSLRKLTMLEADRMRSLFSSGVSKKKLCEIFSAHPPTVYGILSNKFYVRESV